MFKKANKNAVRQNRHRRLRHHLSGTPERPRLCVNRSIENIYAQIIDDVAGVTLVAANTKQADIAKAVAGKTKVEAAGIVGETIARKALEKGITEVVYDRGGYVYTGRVSALADGARKAGLAIGKSDNAAE